MVKKKILVGIVFIFILLSFVIAKDYSLICLGRGETMEFSLCNPAMADRLCDNDLCTYCVYNGTSGNWCPGTANPNPCNALGLSCLNNQGNSTPDLTPPTFEVLSPIEGNVYSDDEVLFDIFNISEQVSLYYSLDGGDDWDRICRNCLDYNDTEKVDDGWNDVIIKAVDVMENEAYFNVSFFVDDSKPDVKKTYPKGGYADGNFEVKFREEFPVELNLIFGNETDNRTHEVNLSECYPDRRYTWCDTYADLSEFDGQEILYWFTLEDIAGSVDVSKEREIIIDTTFPVLHNPGSFFNYTNGSRYVYFDMNITEMNLEEVFYTYYDSRGRLRDKRICSRLEDDGTCYKKKSFRRGDWNITVSIIDEAGNSIGYPISFSVDY